MKAIDQVVVTDVGPRLMIVLWRLMEDAGPNVFRHMLRRALQEEVRLSADRLQVSQAEMLAIIDEGKNVLFGTERKNPVREFLNAVLTERRRQDMKWGVQPKLTDRAGYMELGVVLGEEVGEVMRAMLDATSTRSTPEFRADSLKNLRAELVQVAAVALKIAEAMPEEEQT